MANNKSQINFKIINFQTEWGGLKIAISKIGAYLDFVF
jgi:hypothetical protein